MDVLTNKSLGRALAYDKHFQGSSKPQNLPSEKNHHNSKAQMQQQNEVKINAPTP